MGVLVWIIHQAAASPADCAFIDAARVAAGPGYWSNTVLTALKSADILIFLAFNANRISVAFQASFPAKVILPPARNLLYLLGNRTRRHPLE